MAVFPKDPSFKESTYEDQKKMISQLAQFQKTLLVGGEEEGLYGDMSPDHIARFVLDYFAMVPGCHEITEADKVSLLKDHSEEVHMLRHVSKCDKSALSKDACRTMFLEKCESSSSEDADTIGGATFDFVKMVGNLRLDDEEYALLQALVIFTVCPGLEKPQVVEQAQDYVLHALCAYTFSNEHWDHPMHIMSAKGDLWALTVKMRRAKGMFYGSQSKALTKAQENLISRVVQEQKMYELPSKDDLQKIKAFALGDGEDDSLKRFQHITEITNEAVKLIVEFCKQVPGFDEMLLEDKIILLKACSSELMMLRAVRRYDPKTDSILFANNKPYTREDYRSACMGDSTDSLFDLCRNLRTFEMDNAEYALLSAIVLFSERPGLLLPKLVLMKIQSSYIEALRTYIATNRPQDKENYFPRLLSTLGELRTFGKMNLELFCSFKAQNKKLPALLLEMWGQ